MSRKYRAPIRPRMAGIDRPISMPSAKTRSRAPWSAGGRSAPASSHLPERSTDRAEVEHAEQRGADAALDLDRVSTADVDPLLGLVEVVARDRRAEERRLGVGVHGGAHRDLVRPVTAADAALAEAEQTRRNVQRIASDQVEVWEARPEQERLEEHVAEAEPIDADVRTIGADRRRPARSPCVPISR